MVGFIKVSKTSLDWIFGSEHNGPPISSTISLFPVDPSISSRFIKGRRLTLNGTFDSVHFSVNGFLIGSLTVDLASFLSLTLHQASVLANLGQSFWKQSDLMFWLKINRKFNHFGSFLEVTWAKKLRNSRQHVLLIPEGARSLGWKRFAIAIDSINPKVRNFGDDLFACADFANPSRAYNLNSKESKITRVDALGQCNHFGLWSEAIVCHRPTIRLSWQEIGFKIISLKNLITPFHFLPLNSLSAIFFVTDVNTRKDVLDLSPLVLQEEKLLLEAWSPSVSRIKPISSSNSFWIGFEGVPFHCWTIDVIHSLSAQCGDLLAIDPSTLSLEDLSSVRVKVMNSKGLATIPRLLSLSTVDGEFEVLVNILPSSFDRNLTPFNRIIIGDSQDSSTDDLIDTLPVFLPVAPTLPVCTPAAPTLSSQSVSCDKVHPTHPISYRDILIGTSTIPITTNRQFEKEPLHSLSQLNWGHQSHRTSTSKRAKWAWIPKIQLSMAGSSSSGSSKLLTSPLRSPALNSNPEPSPSHSAPVLAVTLDPLPAIFQDELDEDTPLQLLIEKRLKVARELGLGVDTDKEKIAALFQKSILFDKKAEAQSKKHHLDHIEDLVDEFPLSAAEIEISRTKSYETPIICFYDPTDWWEDSQMREDFLFDEADLIDIPPGFELTCPPPPGFETPRLRRKSFRLQIYQRLEEVNLQFNEAFSLSPSRGVLTGQ